MVYVDTDAAVPRAVFRLRVDLYDDAGVWLEARDIARPDPRDWPVSFSVQAVDDLRVRTVILRLRAYGGRARDRLPDAPRLVRDGRDETPRTEPDPPLSIDRLVLLRLAPDVRGSVVVLLSSSCAGTPPVLDGTRSRTCIAREGELEPVSAPALDPELRKALDSAVGRASSAPCGPLGVAADRLEPPAGRPPACIVGGTFLLGADGLLNEPPSALASTPRRIVRVSTFRIDRHEVTVARYRDALARGFRAPEDVLGQEGPLGTDPSNARATCSFSVLPRDREAYALTCVPWATARAFCQFEGGDLPSEAQWEYAATSSRRSAASEFPWGDALPDCARQLYGRWPLAASRGVCESLHGRGPAPVFDLAGETFLGDVTPDLVHSMGGGVSEWTRDDAADFDAPCWTRPLPANPVCERGREDGHVVRGGSWAAPPTILRAVVRFPADAPSPFVGFRCVYGASEGAVP